MQNTAFPFLGEYQGNEYIRLFAQFSGHNLTQDQNEKQVEFFHGDCVANIHDNIDSNGMFFTKKDTKVEDNKKIYTHVWDEIMNKGKLEMFNDSNFTKTVVMLASPTDVAGHRQCKSYANYLAGFSDITLTIKDVFGMDEKLVKYWNFKVTQSSVFFGIPATGKKVDLDGVTLVRIENGKIA